MKFTRILWPCAICLGLSLLDVPSSSATTITTTQTWNSSHGILGDLEILNGVTLTIDGYTQNIPNDIIVDPGGTTCCRK